MNIAIFCNSSRGLKIANFLKKTYKIKVIFLSKRYLKKNIYKSFKNKKFKCQIINKVNSKKVYDRIKKDKIDINLIAGFPYIFKNKLINSSRFGTMNLHAGRLPQYKGGSPLNWQIINNEKKIGVSIIKVNEKIDSGELLAISNFKISPKDNIISVTKKAEGEFLKIIKKSIKNLINKIYLKNRGKSSYYRQRNASDSEIDLRRMTALEIKNLVRACQKPYKAFYKKNGKNIYINEAALPKRKDLKLINKKNIFYCKKGMIAFK